MPKIISSYQYSYPLLWQKSMRINNYFYHNLAIIQVPLYFSYKCVTSILSVGWQCLKPSIDGWNVQKTRWNISLFSIIPRNVFEITTHPRFACSKPMKKCGSYAYDL